MDIQIRSVRKSKSSHIRFFKINLRLSFPVSRSLDACSSDVTWNGNVGYVCSTLVSATNPSVEFGIQEIIVVIPFTERMGQKSLGSWSFFRITI
jgi:hypothetical protein